MWFKNTKALNAHLRFCRGRNPYKRKEEIVKKEFTFKGWEFKIEGKEGFMKALKEAFDLAKLNKVDELLALFGAIYGLYGAKIIKNFKIRRIKQS